MTGDVGEARARDYGIDVFPMIMSGCYCWSVSDKYGHILKFGRKDTESEAQLAAHTWLRQLMDDEAEAT